ncbi:MAG: sensor histidine kinase [Sodaliphilus sp.]
MTVEKQHIDKRALAIHILCWGLVIFVPSILRPSDFMEERMYHILRSLGPTLCYMAVFYLNYFYLVPKVFLKHRRNTFIWINIGLVLLAFCIYTGWWSWITQYVPIRPRRGPGGHMHPMFALTQILLMGLIAALSLAIRVSQHLKSIENLRREAERVRSEAELANLRSQLNPHFLLNTLNNIYALITIQPEKAQCAVHELSKLLRHVLYDNQQDFVPLQKEVAFIKNYIELMKIRVNQHVSIQTDINIDDKSPTRIAPLIFISLIENAFKHGISPTEPSYITIKISDENDCITCEIRNSCHPKTGNDKSGSGIGLEQVNKRLELTYSGRYQWQRGTSEDGKEYYSIIKIFQL